jgi:hypothetical protein
VYLLTNMNHKNSVLNTISTPWYNGRANLKKNKFSIETMSLERRNELRRLMIGKSRENFFFIWTFELKCENEMK